MSNRDKHAIAVVLVVSLVVVICVVAGIWCVKEEGKPGTDKLCLDFDSLSVCMIGKRDDTTIVRFGAGTPLDWTLKYRLSPEEHDKLVMAFEAWKESKHKHKE